MKKLTIVTLAAMVLLGASALMHAADEAKGERDKYVVILQAGQDTADGMARAMHAMLYTRELYENGDKVALIFDGAGVQWIEEWTNPHSEHPLTPMYTELHDLGITEIICDFCAGALELKDDLEGREVQFSGEFKGHPSIARWTNKGYQIIVL